MQNIQQVTEHSFAALKKEGSREAFRRTLTLIPAVSGQPYAVDADGGYWRTYPFIERARTYDRIESTEQAKEIEYLAPLRQTDRSGVRHPLPHRSP